MAPTWSFSDAQWWKCWLLWNTRFQLRSKGGCSSFFVSALILQTNVFCGLLNTLFLTFLCFWWMLSLDHLEQVMKCCLFLSRKHMCQVHLLQACYSAASWELNTNVPTVNKIYVSRNTSRTRSWLGQWIKMLWSGACRIQFSIFTRSNDSVFANSLFQGTF